MAFTMRDYYRNLRAGKCPMCGGERDVERFPGNHEGGNRTKYLHCSKCLAGNRRRGALISTERKSKYQKDYKARNRRAGLCPKCGKPPVPGLIHCRACLDADARRRRERGLVCVS